MRFEVPPDGSPVALGLSILQYLRLSMALLDILLVKIEYEKRASRRAMYF